MEWKRVKVRYAITLTSNQAKAVERRVYDAFYAALLHIGVEEPYWVPAQQEIRFTIDSMCDFKYNHELIERTIENYIAGV